MNIVTLTLSPAADIEYRAARFGEGLNRVSSHAVSAGGKGINVSRSITASARRSGDPVPFRLRTVAPLGGAAGEMIRWILAGEGIGVTAVKIAGDTRVNASLIPDEGGSIEVNAPGTPVGDALGEIEAAALAGIGPGDVLVIAGSCPRDVPKSYPSELVSKAKARGAAAVLDCDGEALKIAVRAETKPDLIKPNREELISLTGLREDASAEELGRAAQALGIPRVITTMAGDGSLLTSEGKSVFFPTEKRKVVRLKGAGDTFLGAFVYAHCVLGKSAEDAMEYASAAAGAYVAGE